MKKIQKTNRKVISITLVVIMCFSLCIFTAISASAAPIASVSTYQQLADALNDPNISYISVTSDITLTSQLTINRDITIAASSTKTLYQTANYARHFSVTGNNVTLTFNNVILNGNNQYGGIYSTATKATINNPTIINCYVSSSAILANEDLSVSGGKFESNTNFSTGGTVSAYGSGTLNLIACTFTNNHSSNVGAAVYAANTMQNVNIFDCDFIENNASSGGAITSLSQNVYIDNCRFSNNKAISYGALNTKGNVVIENTIFDGNTALATKGGAVNVMGGSMSVINCKFLNNSAKTDGGAIATYDYSALTVDAKTTFTGNSAGNGGYYMYLPADITLHNQQIKSTVFTSPFYYAYNNYDINYTNGIQA